MKYQIIIAVVLGIVLSNVACSGAAVNGQSNDQGKNTAPTAVASNIDQLQPSGTPSSPKLDDPILLKEKLKTTNITNEDVMSIAKLAGLEYLCISQPTMPLHEPSNELLEKAIQAHIYSIGESIYLLDVSCHSIKIPSQQASNNNFFLYSENDAPTLSRMVFEYFEKDLETGKYTRFITYFPNGNAEFSSKKKQLVVNGNFGSGNCGYKSVYKFDDGKPVLIDVVANWDCANNSQDGKQWTKEDIQKMRKLTAETIDELKQS